VPRARSGYRLIIWLSPQGRARLRKGPIWAQPRLKPPRSFPQRAVPPSHRHTGPRLARISAVQRSRKRPEPCPQLGPAGPCSILTRVWCSRWRATLRRPTKASVETGGGGTVTAGWLFILRTAGASWPGPAAASTAGQRRRFTAAPSTLAHYEFRSGSTRCGPTNLTRYSGSVSSAASSGAVAGSCTAVRESQSLDTESPERLAQAPRGPDGTASGSAGSCRSPSASRRICDVVSWQSCLET
jgi:hypothetical protein